MTRVLLTCAVFVAVFAGQWMVGTFEISPRPAHALDEAARLWTVGSRAFDDRLYALAARTLERFVQQFPTDPRAADATLLIGKARLSERALQPALDAFRRAQAMSPPPGQRGEARFWEAETLFRMKRYDDAREVYEDVVSQHKGSPVIPDALYGLAWCDLELGRREAAVADFRRLLADYPDHSSAASATYHLARALVELKHPEEAVPLLRSFVSRYPSHALTPDARYLLGQSLIATGETSDGIGELRAFTRAYPKHDLAAQARRVVADAVVKKGTKTEQAEEYRYLIAQSPPSAEGLYDAGVIASRLGRPQDAEVAWVRLRKEFPDHPLALRGALELAQSAFARSAWKDASALAQAATRSGEDAIRAEALVLLGESDLRLKRYPTAYQAFQQAIEATPEDPALHFRALAGSGLVMEEQRQWTQAARYYDEVAARSPDTTLRTWAKERRAAIASKLKPAGGKSAPRSAAPAPSRHTSSEPRTARRS
jgi:TolA-binding protein